MDCKDAEKKIPYFLRDELDGNRLEEFVEHIENCSECREELSIRKGWNVWKGAATLISRESC